MDREILFRGKRLDNGERVEGYYVPIGDQYHYIFTGKLDITGLYPTFDRHEVDPSTVGQYTGLTDKNGAKIFEGDIVRFPWELGQATDTVIFRDGGFTLTHYWWATVLDGKAEVIGNTHNNPELMGGEDDG